MTRQTVVLLLMLAVVAGILAVAVVLIVDAMVLTPPDVDTTVKVTGAIQ